MLSAVLALTDSTQVSFACWLVLASTSSPASSTTTPLKADPRMARTKTTQGHQRSRCPVCFRFFSDVLRHLNHRNSRCSAWFTDTHAPNDTSHRHLEDHDLLLPDSHPPQPAFTQRSPSPIPSGSLRVEFPGAGLAYDRARTFLDRFNEDKYAPLREYNLYYPFSNKSEWELASFLLTSGLSMRKIDDFLSLKLVSHHKAIDLTNLLITVFFSDRRCPGLVSYSKSAASAA